jgi:hypothetical protein
MDDGPTEADEALSLVQVLDNGAVPVSGLAESAFAALTGLGEAFSVRVGS